MKYVNHSIDLSSFMHPSFDWFCSIVAEDHHMIWDPIIIVPWISLKVMSFPTAVSFLFFDDDDCLYFIRPGEGVTSSTTILHLRSSRRFGIYGPSSRDSAHLIARVPSGGHVRDDTYLLLHGPSNFHCSDEA